MRALLIKAYYTTVIVNFDLSKRNLRGKGADSRRDEEEEYYYIRTHERHDDEFFQRERERFD